MCLWLRLLLFHNNTEQQVIFLFLSVLCCCLLCLLQSSLLPPKRSLPTDFIIRVKIVDINEKFLIKSCTWAKNDTILNLLQAAVIPCHKYQKMIIKCNNYESLTLCTIQICPACYHTSRQWPLPKYAHKVQLNEFIDLQSNHMFGIGLLGKALMLLC